MKLPNWPGRRPPAASRRPGAPLEEKHTHGQAANFQRPGRHGPTGPITFAKANDNCPHLNKCAKPTCRNIMCRSLRCVLQVQVPPQSTPQVSRCNSIICKRRRKRRRGPTDDDDVVPIVKREASGSCIPIRMLTFKNGGRRGEMMRTVALMRGGRYGGGDDGEARGR